MNQWRFCQFLECQALRTNTTPRRTANSPIENFSSDGCALNVTTGQFTTAKPSGCMNVSSNSSRARLGWRITRNERLKFAKLHKN